MCPILLTRTLEIFKQDKRKAEKYVQCKQEVFDSELHTAHRAVNDASMIWVALKKSGCTNC